MSEGLRGNVTAQTRRLVIRSDRRELARVRSFALASASELGSAVRTDDLAVVASELAANAMACDAGDVAVTVSRVDGGGLRLEVHDRSSDRPVVHEHHPWDTQGHRGLALVQAMTDAWGFDPEPQGKVVWCVLPAASAAGGAPGTGPRHALR